MSESRPRIMIAAPASGGGKTTLVTGLLQTLVARGMRPAAFKCGPDYIDPMFHREVLGVPGRNLDLFFTSPEIVRGLFHRGSADADISVLEGVMGFYDGVGATARASSWHLAAATETPVILAINPRGAFLSLAALISGFLRFRENSMIRGVVLNRCGEALFRKAAPMLEAETGLRVFGHVPEMPEAAIESRHLGLATPDAVASLRRKITLMGEQLERSVDIAGLVSVAEQAPPLTATLPEIAPLSGAPARIAVARDAAFCFYYEENLDLLRAYGAELAFFSPLEDGELPAGIGGLYLGGGYPELFAQRLAGNASMRRSVREAVASGLPTLAECGGFLYLQSELRDAEGRAHAMAGALDGTAENAGRLRRFGYVELEAARDNLLCRRGETFPAHEFHYWDSDRNGDSFVARKPAGGGEWPCIVADETLAAGFPHLYFWSRPAVAGRFVEAAMRRSDK